MLICFFVAMYGKGNHCVITQAKLKEMLQNLKSQLSTFMNVDKKT